MVSINYIINPFNPQLNEDCIDIQGVNFTADMKNVILDKHNEFRNQIAGGNVNDFPTASKMLQMVRFLFSFDFDKTYNAR